MPRADNARLISYERKRKRSDAIRKHLPRSDIIKVDPTRVIEPIYRENRSRRPRTAVRCRPAQRSSANASVGRGGRRPGTKSDFSGGAENREQLQFSTSSRREKSAVERGRSGEPFLRGPSIRRRCLSRARSLTAEHPPSGDPTRRASSRDQKGPERGNRKRVPKTTPPPPRSRKSNEKCRLLNGKIIFIYTGILRFR